MPEARSRPGRRAAMLAAALLLSGCAGMYEATGTASQQDLLQMRSDIAALQAALQLTRSEMESAVSQMERRSREQGDTLRQLGALSTRLETLSGDVTTLAARTEDLTQRVEAAKKAAVKPVPQAAAPPAVQVPGGTRSTTGALQPEDVYQAGYIDFSKGSYALSIAGFREFLRRFPDHKLADNAQYWIGESHLSLAHGYANSGQPDKALQELEEGVRELRKVITNYPRGDKVPTALYKEALALLELKQPSVAQARLQYLIENFPRAEETPLARDRLATLKEK